MPVTRTLLVEAVTKRPASAKHLCCDPGFLCRDLGVSTMHLRSASTMRLRCDPGFGVITERPASTKHRIVAASLLPLRRPPGGRFPGCAGRNTTFISHLRLVSLLRLRLLGLSSFASFAAFASFASFAPCASVP